MSFKQQIEALKENWIVEILNDLTTTKLQKLKLLEENDLFDYEDSLTGAFDEYENELLELIAAAGPKPQWEYYTPITDNILNNDDRHRHERVSFPGWLTYIEEYEDEDNPGLITVATARGKEYENFVIQKTAEQITDKIFDYCVENRCIGFTIDW